MKEKKKKDGCDNENESSFASGASGGKATAPQGKGTRVSHVGKPQQKKRSDHDAEQRNVACG